jgi:hypothetical protein
MSVSRFTISITFIFLLFQFTYAQVNPVPTTINDFFLPGSQPNQSGNLESPDKCDNCHGGYDIEVEPAFNWRGSMMSQAARDPLFYACLAISNQDAPQSGDLCLRCHTPPGWLEGRSIPTDGSALTSSDREGVQCDYCHKMVKPTGLGVNPYPSDSAYTEDTYPADQTYLATIDSIPEWSANGMYITDSDNAKRGPFVDAQARHQMFYSPFHQDSSFCGTCHDVSNPAFTDDGTGNYLPNSFDQAAPDFSPYTMFPIERTFSEWKASEYNTPQGVYAPQFGGNKDTVFTCQDCHLRDVTGEGCNKQGTPIRSDLPFHDMTGGNTFIPTVIDDVFPGETDPAALDSGIVRATYMLQNAATMNLSSSVQGSSHLLNVHLINETGHKLPSGYPEGRRIWINVKAYNTSGSQIYESGAYDTSTAVLNHDADVKIYEIKPGISNELSPIVNFPVGPSFHFVLNDSVFFDNRIPPRGFTNAGFQAIQSPPVAYSYTDGQYWDDTEYLIPGAAAKIVATLNYQTTSKEYVEFLRDENHTNSWGDTLYDLWAANGKSAPVAMNKDSIFVEPVVQNSPPVAFCNDITTYADSDCVASASIDSGSYDPDDDPITLVQEPAPPYPLGETVVSLIVSDDGGLSDTCQATVTVVDTIPPAIVCPPDTLFDCALGDAGTATATDYCDADPLISFNDSTVNSSCPLVIARTWTATDSSGNLSTCLQTITVQDTIKPVITCPTDTTVSNDSGQCEAIVYFTADASDNCYLDTVISTPPSGSLFPVGITQVEVTALDSCGNADTCHFNVTVSDTEPPSLVCPIDTTVGNDSGQCGALVSFAITVTDNCAVDTVTYNPPSGGFLAVGTHQIEAIAVDSSGNADTCYFNVTVDDTESPVAICPSDTAIVLDAGQDSVTVEFNFDASDNCGLDSVSSEPLSGSWFGVGTTTVTVAAVDIYGNVDTCYFDIIVAPNSADIPTLSEWGMIILGLLLLAVGTVAIIRKRQTSALSSTK